MNDQQPDLVPQVATSLFRNTISLAGAVLAAISLANILFLFVLTLFSKQSSPYLGILALMVFPAALIFGLLLIPIGMWLERGKRRRAAPGEILPFPRIDLNVPAQRKSFALFLLLSFIFVVLTSVGSYRAYQFTDSVRFCGQICHRVMNPEYTTYLRSPHARVACVECHVGPGAGWYVRSKLSGSYQVYSAIFRKYPRPIPTPVENLRPARETCEQCHWPAKFYGAQLKVFYHYASDEQNTPRQIRMLINTGGAEPSTGLPSGIHWHMIIANQITFIATDPQNQVIPWVQARDSSGRLTVYQSQDAKLSSQKIQQSPKHLMDCIDCHSRPSHIFVAPDLSMDQAMIADRIDPSLPYIKQQGVTVLTASYKTNAEALAEIEKTIQDFYRTKYAEVYSARKQVIQSSIAEIQRIYETTFFPYMKVDWRTHPNNIGHFYFLGCFRCHDGRHVSSDGKVISKDCKACHTVIGQVESGVPLQHELGTAFKHPVDIGDLTQVNCSDCHTGGVGP